MTQKHSKTIGSRFSVTENPIRKFLTLLPQDGSAMLITAPLVTATVSILVEAGTPSVDKPLVENFLLYLHTSKVIELTTNDVGVRSIKKVIYGDNK